MAITGGEAVVRALKALGVTQVFGVVGTAMLEVYDALHDESGIRYVGVRHEQNAVHMADGYARISGRPGVVFAGQPGPGVTNLISGLAEARLAFSPVVVIAGDTSTAQVDRDTFQEVDQKSILAPVTKRTVTVTSAARIGEYIREAFLVATAGRMGPVVVNIPSDLLSASVESVELPELPAQAASAPDPAAVESAARLLSEARRPLILAGAGVTWSRGNDALRAFAERLGAPVAASPGHGDALPNDFPLYVGQVGPRGNPVATELLEQADVVLALGTRLAYNTTLFKRSSLAPDVRIIQTDVEATALARYFPTALAVPADTRAFLEALCSADIEGQRDAQWIQSARTRRAELVAQRVQSAEEHSGALTPAVVYAALNAVLPRDTIVTIDTGTISLHAVDGMQVYLPPALLTPLDFGIVGFSYAAGLGAKLAAPSRPVLTVIGDGGFSMALIELATAADAGIHTITVVVDNGSWGAEKAYQRDFFEGRYTGSELANPDFAMIAAAYGAHGVTATTVAELQDAVRGALDAATSTVIAVPVDPDSITSFRKDSFPHRVATSSIGS
ncbi:thiamine pyrophosphate-binding protein [Gryllotalpicola protaetiae]|uniref:Thiamine pyrophosphate-binding protein n=1 Tax=Gryllotalpicola protaetiae TaxID=2419771 RepID=A0A387BXS3_9MICO|nr:thiamine pyrophosphate-binding protein [Gryllotalpicola protaetiae]AYG03151.1 thiamine pyrophosphate-binding protein [Gryllotalpicola protaetiae]